MVHGAQEMHISLCSSDFNTVKVSEEIHAYIIRYFSYFLGETAARSRNIQIERNGNHLGYCLILYSFSRNDKDHFKDYLCLMGRKQLIHKGLKETPQVVLKKKKSQGQAAPMSKSLEDIHGKESFKDGLSWAVGELSHCRLVVPTLCTVDILEKKNSFCKCL